jgi:mannobiose 2-epimerase
MSGGSTVAALARELRSELVGRILPYWSERVVDRVGGGFFGFIGADGAPDPDAPRGAILNSRILWTFSAAHRALGDPSLCVLADRAADVLRSRFLDPTHGGVYWAVDRAGRAVDDRKLIYAQAFAVYGLAEHHRATGGEESLREATSLFRLIETHAHDATHGGYREAFSRDWVPLEDARLGDTDLNAPGARTRISSTRGQRDAAAAAAAALASRLRSLVELFLNRIVNRATGHLWPCFDEAWTPRPRSSLTATTSRRPGCSLTRRRCSAIRSCRPARGRWRCSWPIPC